MTRISTPGKTRRGKNDGGYILLDVLVTVLIIGIAFESVFAGLFTASRNSSVIVERVGTEITARNTHAERIYNQAE